MKNSFFTSLIAILLLMGCDQGNKQETANEPEWNPSALAAEFEKYLTENLLQSYFPRVLDEEGGGFLTNFSATWEPMPPHPKVIVTQTRYVWTASKAAEMYPNEPLYRKVADHGCRFLLDSMWDTEYGGHYFTLPTTLPDSTRNNFPIFKQSYGNAFAIYALAAYHRLTGDEAALERAKETFYWMEEHVHDPEYGGYFDFSTREGISKKSPVFDPEFFQQRTDVAPYKDYNSSIHILEAFAELYHVWPDSLLEERLREMLVLVRDTFTQEKGFLHLYFEADWTPVTLDGKPAEYIREHYHRDYVSFGHDIETGFLLIEAAEALGEPEDPRTRQVAKKLVDHTMQFGFDPEYQGVVYAGYYFDDNAPEILSRYKDWWSQAEGLNAMLLFYTLYPEETQYREGFLKLWDYTKQNIIDQENGGWYAFGLDTRPEAKNMRKAQGWKGCYHDGRALMRCLRMLE